MYMSMKVATQERIRRTAVEAVGSIPGIEAVVLYGSRARGTARATSDWDIAILSHASPDDSGDRADRGTFDPARSMGHYPEPSCFTRARGRELPVQTRQRRTTE